MQVVISYVVDCYCNMYIHIMYQCIVTEPLEVRIRERLYLLSALLRWRDLRASKSNWLMNIVSSHFCVVFIQSFVSFLKMMFHVNFLQNCTQRLKTYTNPYKNLVQCFFVNFTPFCNLLLNQKSSYYLLCFCYYYS